MCYYKIVIITSLLFLTSCFSPQKKTISLLHISSDSLKIVSNLNDNKIEESMIIATSINQAIDPNLNPSYYIEFNEWYIKKLQKKNADWHYLKKCYSNIFNCKNITANDTPNNKNIAIAYFEWGLLSLRNENRIDDSLIICFEKFIALQKKYAASSTNDESYANAILGIEYNKLGDIKKALNYYEIEKDFIDTTNHNWVVHTAINEAIAYTELTNYNKAIEIINKALLKSKISTTKKADLYTLLASAQYQQKQFSLSSSTIQKAICILDTIKNTNSEVNEKKAQAYIQKAILQSLQNQNLEALTSANKAKEFYIATGILNGRSIAKINNEIGKIYQAGKQYQLALHQYQSALQNILKIDTTNFLINPSPAQLYAENTIIESLQAKASVFEILYDETKKEVYLKAAVECYELIGIVEKSLLQNFTYNESKMLMLTASREISQKAIHTCYQLFKLTQQQIWVQKAFSFAENNKAFVLLESVKKNLATNSFLFTDTLYQQVQQLQTRVANLDRLLLETNNKKNDSTMATIINEKNRLNNKLLYAYNNLKLSSSGYQAILQQKDTANILTKAKQLIDKNTALVEYFIGDSSTFTFLFTLKNGLSIIENDTGFATDLQQYLNFFNNKNKINNEPKLYQQVAYNCYKKTGLLNINTAAINKLLIITDGIINFIPFEAMVTNITENQNPKNFDYLLQKQQISYGYSVSTMLQQNSIDNASKNMVAFAPAFAQNLQGKTTLQYSLQEINAIKKQYNNGKYFTKNEATLASFMANSNNTGIIHIATHANADTTANMESCIMFYDSSLYLNQVYNMHFRANLIVLSACQTNIGIINKSEGSMSLARGFYYAGAKNIITSLWSVNDYSTANLFTNFYSNTTSNNYTTALQKAKISYLKNATAATASPYFWAGFVHIGYSKNSQNYTFIGWLVLALLSSTLFVLVGSYKK